MEVLETDNYPAISRAQRVASKRLSLGRNFKALHKPGHLLTHVIEKQRSQQPPRGITAQDGDSREIPKESSTQTPWVLHLTDSKAGSRNESDLELKRQCSTQCSTEELRGDQGSSTELGIEDAPTGRRSPSSSLPLSTSPPEETRSTPLEKVSTDILQVSRSMRAKGLALEVFISKEISPMVEQIYSSALAQYGRAHRLLSLSADVLPGNLRNANASVGSPSASGGEDLDENHPGQVEVSQDVREKSATRSSSTEKRGRERGRWGGKEDEEKEDYHNAITSGVAGVARVTHASTPVYTAASEATSAELVPGHHQPERAELAKSEDSRSEGQAVFGFASVEVGVSVRKSLILRKEAGGEEDLGSREGDLPSIRPVPTDIRAKMVGLSSIIRRKATQRLATRRRPKHQQQGQPERFSKVRVARDS